MLVCALCSFEQTFSPGLAGSCGEVFSRFLNRLPQWSEGLDNSVCVCVCVCVCVSLVVPMLCFGVVQPLAKSSNATLQSAAATDCLACTFNKKYDFLLDF